MLKQGKRENGDFFPTSSSHRHFGGDKTVSDLPRERRIKMHTYPKRFCIFARDTGTKCL